MIVKKYGYVLCSEAKALVNTVDCEGEMRRGLSAEFRVAYTNNYENYKLACKEGKTRIGKMYTYFSIDMFDGKFIINFPTRRHCEEPPLIEYIEEGLIDLVEVVRQHKIHGIAIPPLGCGQGGLDWGEVRPKIVQAFVTVPDITVYLYEPLGDAYNMTY